MEQTEFQKRIIGIREATGLNRKEFCKKYGIPYRTVTDWELGNRTAPEYVVRLLAYYIKAESMQEKGESSGEQ